MSVILIEINFFFVFDFYPFFKKIDDLTAGQVDAVVEISKPKHVSIGWFVCNSRKMRMSWDQKKKKKIRLVIKDGELKGIVLIENKVRANSIRNEINEKKCQGLKQIKNENVKEKKETF